MRRGRGNSAVGSEVAVQMMFADDIDFPSHSKTFLGWPRISYMFH